MALQNDIESITGRLQQGLISADEANVEMVRCAGVRLVTSSAPRDVRRALNAAVKEGRLGHLKKDGHKPEAYFHPNSIYRAKEKRSSHEREILQLRGSVLVSAAEVDAEFERNT